MIEKNKLILLFILITVLMPSNSFGALNNSLISYYNFDADSFADSLGNYNYTNHGTVNITGILLDSRNYTGTEYIDSNANPAYSGITSNNTINIWVYRSTNTAEEHLISSQGTGINPLLTAFINNAFYTRFESSTTAKCNLDNYNLPIPRNVWNMITIVRNVTNISIYVNGTLNTTTACQNTTQFIISDQAVKTNIGRKSSAEGKYFKGRIDEIGIWNRSLSSGEVNELYNSGSGLAYPFSPSINITYPTSNNSNFIYNSNINFTINNNVSAMDKCWYGTNDNYNSTPVTCNGTLSNNLQIGSVYNITVYANDSSNNVVSQTVYNISVIMNLIVDAHNKTFNDDSNQVSTTFVGALIQANNDIEVIYINLSSRNTGKNCLIYDLQNNLLYNYTIVNISCQTNFSMMKGTIYRIVTSSDVNWKGGQTALAAAPVNATNVYFINGTYRIGTTWYNATQYFAIQNITSYVQLGDDYYNINSSRLLPDPAYYNSTLIGLCSTANANASYLNITATLYFNGTNVSQVTTNNSISNTEINVLNYSTDKMEGDTFILECSATNGINSTGLLNSTELTISAYIRHVLGTIKDKYAAPIANAIIMLIRQTDYMIYNTTSNASGDWQVAVPGGYNYSASAYNPSNITQGGTLRPSIEVPR